MKKIGGLGVLTLGIAIGAATVALGTRTEAQVRAVQTMDELNQRLVVGDELMARKGKALYWFQFIKDRQAGDCYITHTTPNQSSGTLTKTDDNACDGL